MSPENGDIGDRKEQEDGNSDGERGPAPGAALDHESHEPTCYSNDRGKNRRTQRSEAAG